MSHERPAIVLALRDSHLSQGGVRPVSIGGLPAFDRLREEADRRGFRLVDEEAWLAGEVGGQAYLLWDIASHAVLPKAFRDPRLVPAVAWTLESPLVAHRAYHRLASISRQVDVVATFPGAADLLAPGARFEPLWWPNSDRVVSGGPWAERRFLTLVNSNKRANVGLRDVGWRGPTATARTLAASALAASYRLRRAWTVPDLYEERLRAITALATDDGFDLHGVGWDRPVPGADDAARAAVARAYRGPVADKQAALAGYRFVLVLENTVFPGYVTEKVFDAMLAGAIPVYLGAPDIDALLPEGTFVDLRPHGGDYGAVLAALRSLSPSDAEAHLAAARDFLASSAFDRFTGGHFARRLVDLVEVSATRRGGAGG